MTALCLVALISLSACAASSGGRPDAPGAGQGRESGREKEGASVTVESMSVREMVGQMFVVSVGGTEPDYFIEKMVRERNIGGVILFGYNMESEEQVQSLTTSLQRLSMRTQPAVPLFVAVDQEGGDIASAPWVAPQPAAAEVGERGDPAEARAVSERIGTELLRAGVNTNFAPVVDTGFGAAIGNRSFGEDPELVSRMGVASIEGFEAAGIASSVKHFPNHGPAAVDSHEELPVVNHDMKTIESFDLPPFRAAVEAGTPMVMAGHLLYPAVDAQRPASLSPKWMGVLREDLGFDGVVVADDLAMAGASGGGTPGRAAVGAVKAGADLLVVSSPAQQQADAYDAVVAAVEAGDIPEERIRSSVERLLRVKEAYGFAARAH
ncbi:MAG: beta-hexosaminidase [Rubrobacteraceae bacterium]|nr:beta-hexosaminidase [Rubrobacteraceae bacterium]